MEIIKIEVKDNEVVATIKCSDQVWKQTLKNTEAKLLKSIKVEGFRPGKVPTEVAKKHISELDIITNATNSVLLNTIKEFQDSKEFQEFKNNVFHKPTLSFDDKITKEQMIVTLVYANNPKAKDFDYKNISLLETKPEKVSDEDVQQQLNYFKSKNDKLVDSKETKLAKGHTAVFDFRGLLNGEEFPGGKAENFELEIGSGQFIPGFEDQMIGMEVGTQRDIQVKFPDEYHAGDMAGKDVVFELKLHGIKEKEIGEFTDEDVKELKIENVDTVAKLETYIKEKMLEQIKQTNEEILASGLFDYFSKNIEISEIAEPILDEEFEEFKERLMNYISQSGFTFKKYLDLTGKTEESFKISAMEDIKQKIKFDAAIQYVANKEKITVSDKEATERLNELATKYDITLDELKRRLGSAQEKLKTEILSNKVIKKLIELNKNNPRTKLEEKEHCHDEHCCDCEH